MSPEDLACNEVVEIVDDYLEGTMPAADRLRLEEHLRVCEGCRDFEAVIGQRRSDMQALFPPMPAVALPAERAYAFQGLQQRSEHIRIRQPEVGAMTDAVLASLPS